MRMHTVRQIGNPSWTRAEIVASIREFSGIYSERPVKDNEGGMKAPHLFAIWFMARRLEPDLVVESGVWRGQSTWILEKACPTSRIISIDLDLSQRIYTSPAVTYFNQDFSELNWSSVTDRSLAFFDDHQNAYKRLQQCKWFGFKNIIFEDNYPLNQGDCYSLKQAFTQSGFQQADPQKNPDKRPGALRRLMARTGIVTLATETEASQSTAPHDFDSIQLEKNLEIYYEFPPVFKTPKTRWGDEWNDERYPTPEPLLLHVGSPEEQVFLDEATFYTWMCYVKLK